MSATDTRNQAFFMHRDIGNLTKQQQKIMAAISLTNSVYGLHDYSLREIALLTGLEINAVSGRVNELKNMKSPLLIEAKPRKCRVTGRTVTPLIVPVLLGFQDDTPLFAGVDA